MINAPSGGAPKKAQDGISRVQNVAAVELGFRGAPRCLGYVDIYRRKKYVGGATGGPRGWRARPEGVGAPSYLLAASAASWLA